MNQVGKWRRYADIIGKMKIEELKISGFRGFNKFSIKSSELTGFIILAGQNGTGKSTILEIVNFVLRNPDINMLDDTIVQGVTSTEAIWELTVSLKEDEIKHLAEVLKESTPQAYSNVDTVQLIKDSLRVDSRKYLFSIKINIPPKITPQNQATRTYLGNSIWMGTPDWFNQLASQQHFVVYVNPLQDIGEGGTSIFGGAIRDLSMTEVASTDADIRKRGTRTNVNVTNLLNRLALMDLWKIFESMKMKFPTLTEQLERINQIISPLEIFFDVNKLKSGDVVFKMRNNKLNKVYPIVYASSGERQVIGLATLIIQWKRQTLKPIILIDEPDTHLHPEFATRLARFMNDMFPKNADFSCLVATHSSDFIGENLENVYQITTDSSTIEKIDNLEMRANLLQQLGKRFDLSFLISKVILVEGVEKSNNQLEDFEIYQKLVDKDKNKVVFIPVGSSKDSASGGKVGVINRTTVLKEFFTILTKKKDSLKIFALIDKDRQKIFGNNQSIIYTPYINLENIFLLQPEIIAKVASSKTKKFTTTDIKRILDSNESSASSKLMEINGKEHFGKLYNELAKQSQDVKNLGKKGLQVLILNSIKPRSLPKEVKDFLKQLIK